MAEQISRGRREFLRAVPLLSTERSQRNTLKQYNYLTRIICVLCPIFVFSCYALTRAQGRKNFQLKCLSMLNYMYIYVNKFINLYDQIQFIRLLSFLFIYLSICSFIISFYCFSFVFVFSIWQPINVFTSDCLFIHFFITFASSILSLLIDNFFQSLDYHFVDIYFFCTPCFSFPSSHYNPYRLFICFYTQQMACLF